MMVFRCFSTKCLLKSLHFRSFFLPAFVNVEFNLPFFLPSVAEFSLASINNVAKPPTWLAEE